MPIAAAPPPAQVASDSRAAVVCVRAAGPRPLFFNGKLVGKKPRLQVPGRLRTAAEGQCRPVQQPAALEGGRLDLSVTTPGFKACYLPAPEFGYRVTYSAKATARGLACAPIAKSPIGTWK
jgi:hypothetical protein